MRVNYCENCHLLAVTLRTDRMARARDFQTLLMATKSRNACYILMHTHTLTQSYVHKWNKTFIKLWLLSPCMMHINTFYSLFFSFFPSPFFLFCILNADWDTLNWLHKKVLSYSLRATVLEGNICGRSWTFWFRHLWGLSLGLLLY